MTDEIGQMDIKNTKHGYGVAARFLHWFMALAIFAMFGLGLWIDSLSLYNPWYKTAPFLHKSFGIMLFFMLVARLLWRLVNPQPDDSHLTRTEQVLSHVTHIGFYVLLVVLMIAGYLISTAGGRPIEVFNLFSVPSFYQQKGLEDVAGFVHEILAFGIIGLAVVHAAAALKHHFIDRDVTLTRMWRGKSQN